MYLLPASSVAMGKSRLLSGLATSWKRSPEVHWCLSWSWLCFRLACYIYTSSIYIFQKTTSQQRRKWMKSTWYYAHRGLTGTLLRRVRWMRWHCPPDTGFEIRTRAVWARARYLSVAEALHNIVSLRVSREEALCFFGTWRPEWGSNPRFSKQTALTTAPA